MLGENAPCKDKSSENFVRRSTRLDFVYRCCIVFPSLWHITLFYCIIVSQPYSYLWAMLRSGNQSLRMIKNTRTIIFFSLMSLSAKKILLLRDNISSDLFNIKLGLIRKLKGYVLRWMYNVNIKLIRDSRPSLLRG